jgi:hypothetical protein
MKYLLADGQAQSSAPKIPGATLIHLSECVKECGKWLHPNPMNVSKT